MADYKITIAGEYNKFKPIVDDLARLTEVIESKNFSYSALIDEFNDLIKRCQPFDDALIKYNELESSLRFRRKKSIR